MARGREEGYLSFSSYTSGITRTERFGWRPVCCIRFSFFLCAISLPRPEEKACIYQLVGGLQMKRLPLPSMVIPHQSTCHCMSFSLSLSHRARMREEKKVHSHYSTLSRFLYTPHLLFAAQTANCIKQGAIQSLLLCVPSGSGRRTTTYAMAESTSSRKTLSHRIHSVSQVFRQIRTAAGKRVPIPRPRHPVDTEIWLRQQPPRWL